MDYAGLPEIKRELIPGKNYDHKLAEIEGKIHALEITDPDWLSEAATLKAEYDRYDAMETEPDEWKPSFTGRLIGEVLASLDDQGWRQWLLAGDWRFYAQRNPEAKKRDPRATPLVVAEGSEQLLQDIAKATGLTAGQVMSLDWESVLASSSASG